MRALDTSVAVPALAAWHEGHGDVVAEINAEDRLPDHVVVEIYSVLTRLPPLLRLSAAQAARVLRERFPPPYLSLDQEIRESLVSTCAAAGVAGGAVYDGLVALTASLHEVTLLTRDARAATTYRRLQVEHERLG